MILIIVNFGFSKFESLTYYFCSTDNSWKGHGSLEVPHLAVPLSPQMAGTMSYNFVRWQGYMLVPGIQSQPPAFRRPHEDRSAIHVNQRLKPREINQCSMKCCRELRDQSNSDICVLPACSVSAAHWQQRLSQLGSRLCHLLAGRFWAVA